MSRSDREQKIVNAINKIVKDHEEETTEFRARARENYLMFVKGSRFKGKEPWQAQFSINKLESSIRVAAGRLKSILINNPNWFSLEPRNPDNPVAVELAQPLERLLKYYLDTARFTRVAGTFILQSLISLGSIVVGWRQKLIPNPRYILEEAEKLRAEQQRKLANRVDNPAPPPELPSDDFLRELDKVTDELIGDLTGESTSASIKTPKFIQVGCLDLKVPNPEKVGWDTSVQYMDESPFNFFKTEVPLWWIREQAKNGVFKKSAVKKVSQKSLDASRAIQRSVYNRVNDAKKANLIPLTVYFGPLIIDDKVEDPYYYAVIAHDSVILKDGTYPYWEPPGHQQTPMVNMAPREVPQRATGAGIGETAAGLQKAFDALAQIQFDQTLFSVAGLNIVNITDLVDKSVIEEGIEPGKWLVVRNKPSDVFERVKLTNDVERQVLPMQEQLRLGIQELTQISDLLSGSANLRSRTSATEVANRTQGAEQAVSDIAIDLEQGFLIPTLEKCFARVLQFGLLELESNPEIKNILSPADISKLKDLNESDRINILNQFYSFKIRGFSYSPNRIEEVRVLNELLQLANSGGPVGQLLPMVDVLKEWFRKNDMPELADKINPNTQTAQITAENQLLISGKAVPVSESDDHQLHIELQSRLAVSGAATPELMQHLQAHQQMLQQIEAIKEEQKLLGRTNGRGVTQ
ncbi:MAG: hypothetical protein D6694_12760 [Gammaproteobacteria bacterium]|nr:MAG: hypothetical protein D6694_12760 [Gammaproteobacteria bacterium]